MKNYFFIPIFIFFAVYFIAGVAMAQDAVNYNDEVIVDSDLDGLTDKGEQQLYKTDPGNQDTDADGYLDGAEVLADTDPTDGADYPGHRAADIAADPVVNLETPWVWYVSRSAGLLGFVFLWLTIFLGLSIRNPLLKKLVEPIYSFDLHCFLAAAAVFWSLVHGTSFLFHSDRLALKAKEVFIPYAYGGTLVNTSYLALGIMAFYVMAVMVITSYLRSHLNHWLWRIVHFLNPVAFVFVVVHGYMNGTDMKNDWVSAAFLLSAYFLAIVYIMSLVSFLRSRLRKPAVENAGVQQEGQNPEQKLKND